MLVEKENRQAEDISDGDDGEKKFRLSFRVMYSKMIRKTLP